MSDTCILAYMLKIYISNVGTFELWKSFECWVTFYQLFPYFLFWTCISEVKSRPYNAQHKILKTYSILVF